MSVVKTYITEIEAGLVKLAAERLQMKRNELEQMHQVALQELASELKPISNAYKIPDGVNVDFDKDEKGTFFVYEHPKPEGPKLVSTRPARRRAQKAATKAAKKG